MRTGVNTLVEYSRTVAEEVSTMVKTNVVEKTCNLDQKTNINNLIVTPTIEEENETNLYNPLLC